MIKPPVILDEHGDVLFFRSVEDARGYVEPIDVENNEYVGYDSEGRRLNLDVSTTPEPAFFGLMKVKAKEVVIESTEAEPQHEQELRDLLLDFLVRIGASSESLQQAPLETLVGESLRRSGFK